MTTPIKTLIAAEKAYSKAKAELETAKLEATRYVMDSGYNEVDIEGYTVKIKEYKKQKIQDTADILDLENQLELIRNKITEVNKQKIYDLQKQKFYLEVELEQLMHNDMTESIENKIEAKRQKLSDSTESHYEVYCKFNNKAAEACLDTRLLKKYVKKGWQLRDECPKGISKGQVLKFLLEYKDSENIENEWDNLVDRHRHNLKC